MRPEDHAAFDDAYRANRAAVLRYLRVRCRDSDDALDVAAVTFERSFRAHVRGDPRALTLAWLITTARNAAVDLSRRQAVRAAAANFGLVNGVQSSPESELIAAEDRGHIVSAVRSLPATTRDAISLRYGLGWSTREIAKSLGKSEPATQKLIERGLRVLRETLG